VSQKSTTEEPKAPRRRKAASPHGEVRILDNAEVVTASEPAPAPAPVVEEAPPAPVVVEAAPAPAVVEAPAPAAAPEAKAAPKKKVVKSIPPPPGWVTQAAPAVSAAPAAPAARPAPVAAPAPVVAPAPAAAAPVTTYVWQVMVEGGDAPFFVVAADRAGAARLLQGRASDAQLAKATYIQMGAVL
jgi:hypothetical protein